MINKLIKSIKQHNKVFVIFQDARMIFESHVNTENVELSDGTLRIGEIGNLLCIKGINNFVVTENDGDWYLEDGSRFINIFLP